MAAVSFQSKDNILSSSTGIISSKGNLSSQPNDAFIKNTTSSVKWVQSLKKAISKLFHLKDSTNLNSKSSKSNSSDKDFVATKSTILKSGTFTAAYRSTSSPADLALSSDSLGSKSLKSIDEDKSTTTKKVSKLPPFIPLTVPSKNENHSKKAELEKAARAADLNSILKGTYLWPHEFSSKYSIVGVIGEGAFGFVLMAVQLTSSMV